MEPGVQGGTCPPPPPKFLKQNPKIIKNIVEKRVFRGKIDAQWQKKSQNDLENWKFCECDVKTPIFGDFSVRRDIIPVWLSLAPLSPHYHTRDRCRGGGGWFGDLVPPPPPPKADAGSAPAPTSNVRHSLRDRIGNFDGSGGGGGCESKNSSWDPRPI